MQFLTLFTAYVCLERLTLVSSHPTNAIVSSEDELEVLRRREETRRSLIRRERQFTQDDLYKNWPTFAQLPFDNNYPTKAAWGVWVSQSWCSHRRIHEKSKQG
jgi:hypothetical protein